MGYRRSWSRYDNGYGSWAPYVPVATRRANAAKAARNLEKKRGRPLSPVRIEGRAIATSFWGKAWCDNLERYSDFSNRLPRGKTYVRNGSVIDLQISKRKITALVSGSELYELKITIDPLPPKTWQAIRRDCASSVASLIDLLQGRFDRGVMERLTQRDGGLFPKPKEIEMNCSCPDYAGMCKHIAAVMYGVGARLDESPELLFTLRDVDHLDLIGEAVSSENLDRAFAGDSADTIASDDLGAMFGIELETSAAPSAGNSPSPKVRRQKRSVPKAASPRRTTAGKAAKSQPAKNGVRIPVKLSAETIAVKKPQKAKKSAVPQTPRAKAKGKKQRTAAPRTAARTRRA